MIDSGTKTAGLEHANTLLTQQRYIIIIIISLRCTEAQGNKGCGKTVAGKNVT